MKPTCTSTLSFGSCLRWMGCVKEKAPGNCFLVKSSPKKDELTG